MEQGTVRRVGVRTTLSRLSECLNGEFAVLVAGGDGAALQDLYGRYSRPVFSLLLRIVSGPSCGRGACPGDLLASVASGRHLRPRQGALLGLDIPDRHRAALDEIRRRDARPR